jgi:hypothetical protein
MPPQYALEACVDFKRTYKSNKSESDSDETDEEPDEEQQPKAKKETLVMNHATFGTRNLSTRKKLCLLQQALAYIKNQSTCI